MTMAGVEAPWQLQFKKVEQRCDYLLTSGLWSDCTFMVGSEPYKAEFPAHKLILAMASPVFEAMFYGWLSVVTSHHTFKRYIYTGHIDIDSFDMSWKLWHGGKKYKLPHLVNECNRYICPVVSPKNVCQAYEFAHFFEEKTIMDKCIEIISTKTKEVLNDNSFKDIELDTLITVLSLEQLNVDSELEPIQAVARYAEVEQKRQKQISPPVECEPPSDKLSQLRLEPPTSEEKIQKALDKQILEPLINVLAHGDDKCQEEAAWAISKSNLCFNGTVLQLNVLVSTGFLQPYCDFLSSPDHPAVEAILNGLSELLEKVQVLTKLTICGKLRQIGVPKLLSTLQQHEDEKIRLEASRLVRACFPSDV